MKTTILLSLALALPVFTSCGEATDAAGSMADKAGSMAEKAGEAVGIDAGSMITKLTEGLGSIKDVASAEKFKSMAGPLVDSLSGMKDKLGSVPGLDALKSALGSVNMEGGIGAVIGPIIEKLKGLVM